MADQALFDALRVWDANGLPAAGATATFYASGTLTLISVYGDKDGSTLATNPVVADGNGVLPQRYVLEAARCIIRDSAGVTLHDIDPVPTIKSTFGAASSLSFEPTTNVPADDVQAAIELVDSNARSRTADFGDMTTYDKADFETLLATWLTGTGTDHKLITPTQLRAVIRRGWGGVPVAVLEDRRTQGSNGGTLTSGAWETRVLNTEVRDTVGVTSLVSNEFVLTDDCWVEWETTFSGTGASTSRIYNVTDAVASAGIGTVVSPATGATAISVGGCALLKDKTYRLESRVTTTQTTTGGGIGANFQQEVFSRLKFWLI